MDDEELTQDILDQFDLICTQQQLQNVNVSNVSVDRFSSLVLRGNAPEFSNDVQSSLSRTSSLDRRKVKNPEAFADRTVESPAVIERLNREVASLREELYMKLGELATLKDSSSRTNALKSDAIVRLENSLACQREEFQRKISELTAQLASKEADYRTVTTELTLVREQFSNVRLPVAQDRSNDFSPASQLIASMVTSLFGSATPNGMPNKAHQPSFGSPSNDHLPAPVTPVPSRRRPLMGGTWRLDHLNRCDPTNRTYVTPRYHEEPSMQQALPINTVESTQYCQQEGEGIPRKRRRQNRSFSGSPVVSEIDDRVKPMVDTAVETDPLMQALPTSSVGPLRCRSNVLRFGLAYSGCFTEPSGLHGLASSLLSINMTALNTDSEILARNKENVAPLTVNGRSPIATDVPSTNIFSDVLDTDDYLFGLSSLVSGDCDGTFGSYEKEITQNELGAITKKALNAVPHLLKNIEKSIQESLSALRWKREPSPLDPSGDTDKSCAQRMEEIGQPPKLNPSVLCPTDDGGISYLGEDPFAGAPASQMVAPLINPPSRSGFSRSPANPFHTPGQLFLSAPADFHSVVTADSSQTNSTLPLPLPVRTSLEQGIRGLKRIQCLLKALQSWRLSSSGEPNNNHSSVHTDLQMLSVTISDLITRLVNGLAEFILWRFLQNSLPSHSVVSSNIHVLPYQQSATQSQSGFQLSSAGLNSAQPDSSIPEEIGHYLTRLSEMSLNLAALAACCVDSVKSETESNSAKFEWKLSPVNCMIIAVGISYSSEIDRGAGNPVEMSDWHLSSTSNEGSKEILFVQLLRYMLSRGHWDLGHQDLDWSAQWLGGPTCTSRGEISVELDYLRRMFCSDMKCPLLSIAVWISRVGERLYSMEINAFEARTRRSCVSDCAFEKSTLPFVRLLHEFSSFVAVLTARNDIVWPDSCPCKAQIYSTLVSLAVRPMCQLRILPSTITINTDSADLEEIYKLWSTRMHYVIAFGQLSRALTGLLWRHGENSFQMYTDSLPSYFSVISGLSNWIQQSKALLRSSFTSPSDCADQDSILRPELVEELFDFDMAPETAAKV